MNQNFRLDALRLRLLCALLFVLSACAQVAGQTPAPASPTPYRVAYRLSMPEPLSHLFEVKIEVAGLSKGTHVDFQMPRWSPGRYGVFEFAKNVQEAQAFGGICPPGAKCKRWEIPLSRLDTQTWRAETADNIALTFIYRVFADDLSGTFSQLDARHANYNGHSVFMYVVGHKQDPVTLTIDPPPRWRIINGYTTRANQHQFQFPNYDVMADAPTEIAPDWTLDEFKVEGKTYRVVVHSFGEEGGRRASLARDIEKIVRAETKMWGAPEFESYTFLIHFDPTARRGDGMEHLNSTQLITTRTLASEEGYTGTLETAAHEFFHVWNIKRLRPAGLGPWDFTAPVNTRGLWIGEGFTNYYGSMMMHRAALWTERQLLEAFEGTLAEVENLPGSRLMSAEEASLLAAFLDRASHDQRTNLANTSVSYYPKGELLGFALDLLIRGRTRGRASLDDVMRRAYEEFYLRSPNESYYLRGRGYTNEDFARVASEVTGTDMSEFFKRHVRGTEQPPYEEALRYVGLRLVRRPDERQPFNAGIKTQEGSITAILPNSPAERAGLKQGDIIISVGKTAISEGRWRDALNTFKQGERVPLTLRRGSQTIDTHLTLDAPDNFVYRIEEIKDAPKDALALRAAWLAGRNL
ncbi:MAG TPA: PDZ domain-containing protein [Pyrinomonadaceae bacterium]|jgi:predicted metalloprotease with PDZ domain